jgi:A/G-specific adenine glycosylase
MAPADIPAPLLRRIRRKLLVWYDRNRRDLPWRRTKDPYAIWLSEVMLQQTQVAMAIPYYQRFLSRFLTIRDLAAADLDEVLRLWAGLGYYARARSLHKAAKAVVESYGGRLPRRAEELRRLPGFGRYTAGAVASVAFGQRAAAVDGNAVRVLARLFDVRADVRRGGGLDAVWESAERLVPPKQPGDWNQAVMELGAVVCLPGKAARCGQCPLRAECASLAAGTVAELPKRAKKQAVRIETHVVAAIETAGRFLFVKRPAKGLWGGLWELPSVVLTDGRSPRAAAGDLASEMLGEPVRSEPQPFCDLRRQLTHRTIRFVGYRCRAKTLEGHPPRQQRPPRRSDARWLYLAESESLGCSQGMRQVIARLRDHSISAATCATTERCRASRL